MPITFTAHGYIELWDSSGNLLSRHTLEREATEAASGLSDGDYIL